MIPCAIFACLLQRHAILNNASVELGSCLPLAILAILQLYNRSFELGKMCLINGKDYCCLFKNIKIFYRIVPLLKKNPYDRQDTGNKWINCLPKLIIQILLITFLFSRFFGTNSTCTSFSIYRCILYIYMRSLFIYLHLKQHSEFGCLCYCFSSLLCFNDPFLAINTFLWIRNIMEENSNN